MSNHPMREKVLQVIVIEKSLDFSGDYCKHFECKGAK